MVVSVCHYKHGCSRYTAGARAVKCHHVGNDCDDEDGVVHDGGGDDGEDVGKVGGCDDGDDDDMSMIPMMIRNMAMVAMMMTMMTMMMLLLMMMLMMVMMTVMMMVMTVTVMGDAEDNEEGEQAVEPSSPKHDFWQLFDVRSPKCYSRINVVVLRIQVTAWVPAHQSRSNSKMLLRP